MSKTEENIKAAFAGEAKAVVRLRLYADKAMDEGYPQIAKLFRAISEAELIHAKKHLKNMKELKDTESNLTASFEGEKNVSEVLYPEFIKTAHEEDNPIAALAFTYSRDAEEFHASLYKKMLDHFAQERETEYYVCNVCGYVSDGILPEKCPICQAKQEAFFVVK
ncbi:MAG TPA: rubrerythrin family protein [bacterium]|nr:rubrerythrin family protein [bacterium]